jgi:hypothetical protein
MLLTAGVLFSASFYSQKMNYPKALKEIKQILILELPFQIRSEIWKMILKLPKNG